MLGVESDPEQLDLLRGPDGKLPQDVFRQMRQRGRGRPLGAGNKRSDKLAKLICQQAGDPVLFMASIYAMPLDQMIELLLIADSTAEREERLLELVEQTEQAVMKITPTLVMSNPAAVNELTSLLDRVVDIAKGLKSRPGDVAVKALNTQLQAAREVAQYVHSKKPVEFEANVKLDGILVMPPAMPSAPVEHMLEKVRDAINSGQVSAQQLSDMRMVDGEWADVDQPDGEDG
ncbi:hypothetical protein AI27_05065 [Sphingomonas sp. BHC-A]|nr:hypothetical protein AI27_05065 [Sphingomonas sp. BHC-A]